jgi:uncharacterized protein (DUF1800 family)
MTLFWHNHFATAYTKIAGALALKKARATWPRSRPKIPTRSKGQIELFRQHAVGNFRDLLLAVAKDTAMLVWLDGRTNIKGRPQENFARELMELFTMGVDTFAEADVYAGARVFTGWNLARPSNAYYTFSYVAGQHDTTAKEFTFPIYSNGSKVIPARSADAGMQDGVDLINAVAAHPATGPRLARKLYQYFISEVSEPDAGLISELATTYYRSGFEMKPVLQRLFLSTQFCRRGKSILALLVARRVRRPLDQRSWLDRLFSQRCARPDVEHGSATVRAARCRRVGPGSELVFKWRDADAHELRVAAGNQSEIQPARHRAWRTFVARGARHADARSFDGCTVRARTIPGLLDYARAGTAWTGSDAQLLVKAPGLAHLIVGSGDYQLV